MPAVVIASEAFTKLLTVMLRSQQAPDSLAVVLRGNPEYLDQTAIDTLADQVLDDVVQQLGGAQRVHELIGGETK